MSISFNEIPNNIRVPLCYIEFDNSGAVSGAPQTQQKTLLMGYKLPNGTVSSGVPTRITSVAAARDFFGHGSMLEAMAQTYIKANPVGDLWAIAVDDAKGTAANGKIVISGTVAYPGQIALLIAGMSLPITVKDGDTAAAVAKKISDAINNTATLPVTASLENNQVNLACRWTGITGNDIDVRFNYYTGQSLPIGLGVIITPLSGGVGNPDLSVVVTSLGDTWWHYVINPFTDTVNLNLLRTEFISRWGGLRQIDSILFMAYRGTHAQSSTFGLARNDHLFCTIATGYAPQPPYVWAAAVAGVASRSLSIDPARPLQSLQLPDILPPAIQDRFTWQERNLLLFDGLSTCAITAGDIVQIERLISMYRVNSYGNPDPSYLDIETIATLGYLRYAVHTRLTQKFPRHKLADNGTRVSAGQPIVTPDIIETELLALFTELEYIGLVEDFDEYKKSLIVERDSNDRNRVNVRDNPNLVNQFRIYAQAIQFVL